MKNSNIGKSHVGYGGRGTHDVFMDEDAHFVHHHDDAQDFIQASDGSTHRGSDGYRKASEQSKLNINVVNPQVSRRTILAGAGVAGILSALPVPRYAFAQEGAAHHGNTLVAIFMRGGLDGLGAVIPLGDPHYQNLRPGLKLTDEVVLPVAGTSFGLNPAMKALHDIQSNMAIIQSTGHTNPSRSHFHKQDLHEIGMATANVRTGWLARYLLTSSSQESTFRAITLGANAANMVAFEDKTTLSMASLGDLRLNGTPGVPQDRVDDNILRMWDSVSGGTGKQTLTNTLNAANKAQELRNIPAGVGYYGNFGTQLSDAARVIKANLGAEVICVDIDGWDMHANMGQANNGSLHSKLQGFSDNLAAFWKDLGADYQKKTTVVTMSEFGRRADLNGGGGTDHGYGNVMFVLGDGINAGSHGEFPGLGADVQDGQALAMTTDYRDVAGEILQKKMGADATALKQIFPDHTVNPLGVFK